MAKALQHHLRRDPVCKSIGPSPTTVLVAGDHAEAKDVLIEAIRAGGVEAVDVGSMQRSRELEAMGFRNQPSAFVAAEP